MNVIFLVLRDHLGSIVKIVDTNGATVFAASYDAWGKQTVTTNTLKFHRGFTGHEHLPEFNLINMNGRMYDPVLGRFLSPDPYVQMPDNSQNFNRYSYAMNNPLIYTDPSGEIIFSILSAIFCPALLPMAIQTDIGWITGGLGAKASGGSFWQGALVGGAIGMANGALSMASPIKIPLFGESGLSLGIAPQFSIGTDGFGLGFNATLGYDLGKSVNFLKGFNAGVNFGGTFYATAPGTGNSGFEGRLGYGIGYEGKMGKVPFQLGLGSTYFFGGQTSQLSGYGYAGRWNGRLTYENDTYIPLPGLGLFEGPGGPERDRYRTAAVRFDITGGKLKGFNAGFNIFTGQADNGVNRFQGPHGTYNGPGANKYRMGALYAGYYNARFGINSENLVRGPIQNGFHDSKLGGAPRFEVLNHPNRLYFGFYSPNPYTLW